MVYVYPWAEYQRQAEELYLKSPFKARYCVKWKPKEGKLVLKITDDVTCLKYKTHSSVYLNRFEALNLSLMEKMTNRRPPPPAALLATPSPARAGTPGPSTSKLGVQKMDVDEESRSATPTPANTGSPSLPAKKKKPNKKKK